MNVRARQAFGLVVLLATSAALVDCFGSSSNNPPADAGFDSTSSDVFIGPEAGDDVASEAGPVDSSVEAAADTSAATDSAPADVTQPEAEAGPPVVETIAQGLLSPLVIAVDPSFIYILESATPTDDSGFTGDVRRCPIGGCGTNPPTVVMASASIPGGMAISGTTLFWSDAFHLIMTCDVSTIPCTGSTFATIVDDAGMATFPVQLWVNGTHLYWFVDFGSDRAIETCPVTGCTAGYPKTVLYAGAGTTLSGTTTSGLAIDGSYAYVSLFNGGPIYRYAMTSAESADIATETALGTGSTTAFAAHDLDLDGTWLRWAESGGTRVAGCTTPGCSPVVDVATGRVMPYAVRHDATYIYGVDQGASLSAGILWRLHK